MTLRGRALRDEVERYLLGRLSVADRDRFERRLFDDPAVWSAVRKAEDRLIEGYLAGELTADRRADFERHFAASEARRKQIAVTRLLVTGALPATSQPTPVEPSAEATARPHGARDPWRLAPWLAAAALVAVGITWAVRPRPALPTAAVATASPLSSSAAAPVAGASAGPTSSPARAAANAPALESHATAPALVLSGALLRGHGRLPRLVLDGSQAAVRIEAVLDGRTSGEHRATLLTIEGRTVWSGKAELSDDGRSARVDFPSGVLSPGDYVLRVTAAGQSPDDGTEYAFRVSTR